MNSFTSKFALLSALSASALFALGAYSASAQTPWDVYRQQYQLSTGTSGSSNQPAAQTRIGAPQGQAAGQGGAIGQTGNTGAQSRIIQSEMPVARQQGGGQIAPGAGPTQTGTTPNRVIQSELPVAGQITPGAGPTQTGATPNRVIQSEVPVAGQQGAAPTTTAGAGRDLFQFTNQNAGTGQVQQGAEGVTRYLQQGVSVETATVPQLASAIAQYAAMNSETIIGALASLAAAYPEQAVKIAEAARLALPDRALEVAMAIATVVPAAAIQIVVALAAADPSLAPTLAGLILPAAGGVNQTSSRNTGLVTLQEIPVVARTRITTPTTPDDNNASPTGRS